METLFLTVLHMSLSACTVIIAVLLVRLLMSGAPKKWSYLLWGVVGFRLCCPVSFRAAFSLFSMVPVQTQRMENLLPAVSVDAIPTSGPGVVSTPAATPEIAAATHHLWPTLGVVLWCAGMAALVIYSLVRVLRLRTLLLDAVQLEPGVWQSDRISTPFLMGLIHPKIYIPVGTDAETSCYVLAHERVHLRRADHWIKALAFLILAVHWFNPLCWLAFVLMNRDMELSCDERVLAEHNAVADTYCLSLLHFAADGRFPNPGMLAFGESDVKRRVQNALKWHQPKRWATMLAALLCIAAVAACAANPKNDAEQEAIKTVAMQASKLSVSQSCVVDSGGALLPGIVETYQQQLTNVFTEDSGYIDQYTEIMQSIVDSFDAATDVVLDNQILDFSVRKLKVDGNQAMLVCKIKSLQKYIPHREDGGYDVIFTASKEKITYMLQKGEDGQWRVRSFDSEGNVFGTPDEMGFKGNYEEKTFPTREEACRYAAAYAPGKQAETAADESAIIQRLLNLQEADILQFAGSFSSSDPAYNDTLAATIRNAAEKAVPETDDDPLPMPWYWADLYLSKTPGGGFGAVSETVRFQEDLTAPLVHVQYVNPETNVSERLCVEDETLYWMIRNNYTLEERVETSVLAPYWDVIHNRAADTVKRLDGLEGYELTSFYKVETLADKAHSYDVFFWRAAYKTNDPNTLTLAGGAILDSQARVIGLNEEECYFVVRDDGFYRFFGYYVPFGYDDTSIRAHNLELIQNAFAQEESE